MRLQQVRTIHLNRVTSTHHQLSSQELELILNTLSRNRGEWMNFSKDTMRKKLTKTHLLKFNNNNKMLLSKFLKMTMMINMCRNTMTTGNSSNNQYKSSLWKLKSSIRWSRLRLINSTDKRENLLSWMKDTSRLNKKLRCNRPLKSRSISNKNSTKLNR